MTTAPLSRLMAAWGLGLALIALAPSTGAPRAAAQPMAQHGDMPMGPSPASATVRTDLVTEPAPPLPRQPVVLTLTLREAASGAPVNDLQLEHQRLLHLIVVSDDLAFFDHVHPTRVGQGQFRLQYRFPTSGPYHLFVDFVSAAAGPQHASVPLVVAGPAPPPVALDQGPLTVDASNAHVELSVDPWPPRVGQPTRLTFHLTQEGRPLDMLEPYLGVAGHLVAVSQDLQEYVHTHPGEHPMGGAMEDMEMPMAPAGAHFGPDVTFTLTFQRPGLHKVWGQFSLDGDTFTAPFVLSVVDAGG